MTIKSRKNGSQPKQLYLHRYGCPICRQNITQLRVLYKLKQPQMECIDWSAKDEYETELKRIHMEMKTGRYLDRFHTHFMNEWQSFLYLFLISRSGKTVMNNFTVSIWLLDVIWTLGNNFFFAGYYAPVFRILVILFTFGNSLYFLHTLATQIFSKIREDFYKRKRSLLKIDLVPRFTFYGVSGYFGLCFIRGIFPNIILFLIQIGGCCIVGFLLLVAAMRGACVDEF